jgi:hypothetical protein
MSGAATIPMPAGAVPADGMGAGSGTPQTKTGAPVPMPAGAVSADDAQSAGGTQWNSQGQIVAPPMPQRRPQSSEEFNQAQLAGGYTEPSEADGKPITYLMQKPDEEYGDFMKRGFQHGQTVTQQEMNEESNQPKKIADAAIVRPAEYASIYAASVVGLDKLTDAYEATSSIAQGGYQVASRALKPLTEPLLEQAQMFAKNPKLYTEWAVHTTLKWAAEHPVEAIKVGSGVTSALAMGGAAWHYITSDKDQQ